MTALRRLNKRNKFVDDTKISGLGLYTIHLQNSTACSF
jgi:hypothetical protein